PHIIVCRTEHTLGNERKKKIAEFCNVDYDSVIEALDAETIYDVPLSLKKEKLDQIVLDKFGYQDTPETELTEWNKFLQRFKFPKKEITIGLIGKYIELKDAYISIYESFIHAGAQNECKVNVERIHAEDINKNNLKEKLGNLDGIFVAPGFGQRGIDGKIYAIQYARENNIPFFGICLGMQMAVIEFARNVLKIEDANSSEMKQNCQNPVIDMMQEQKTIVNMGGTMRLGAYACYVKENTLAHKIYGQSNISERHRHRYEFNNKYLEIFHDNGMIASGINPDSELVEIVEIPNHKFFIGVQFHPELKSTILKPHPLFCSFVEACLK
ncbi:MAG TPA: CTP synthase, partial [Chitinophagales bacterium]|nr:CTP synthase [Chitinophagales bacterium]